MQKEKGRKRLFDIIQIGRREDRASRAFDVLIAIAILANIAVLFIGTFEGAAPYRGLLFGIESVTVAIFIVEYILRIVTADFLYPQLSRGRAILRFLVSFEGIVDLCTILPFFFLSGFVVFRMLRVVRILHLFRINAYYDSINVITSVLKEKKNQLLSSIFIVLVLMLAASLSMYSAEHEAQPEVFSNAFSGIWWSISTILTIGYGDIYPVTITGQLMGAIISFLGVGVVAIPTGIISAGFVEQYTRMQNRTPQGAACTGRRAGTVSAFVDEKSPFLGRSVAEAEALLPVDIVAFVREGAVIVPSASVRMQEGDMIIYRSVAEAAQDVRGAMEPGKPGKGSA